MIVKQRILGFIATDMSAVVILHHGRQILDPYSAGNPERKAQRGRTLAFKCAVSIYRVSSDRSSKLDQIWYYLNPSSSFCIILKTT